MGKPSKGKKFENLGKGMNRSFVPHCQIADSKGAEEFAKHDEHLQCRRKPRSLYTFGCGSEANAYAHFVSPV
ncbi:hypothetical protein ACFX1T_012612 [Malus domestica]